MGALAAALTACAALNAALHAGPPPARAAASKLDADTAVESAALLSLGMRRLAADLGMVRLLVYYGSPEEGHEDHGHQGHAHAGFDAEHPEHSWGGGEYAGLGPRAMRILDLDPAFAYAALYSAGALAFNLNRPEEALELLRYGLERDPKNPNYQAYAAAIGFHKRGDAAGVIRLLEPVLLQPDCPSMIKNMMAFLYRRSGRRDKAVALYREILETSRDAGYRATAEKALRSLGE